MKHPTDEIIIAYLYKEAAAEDIESVERHIAECRDCAQKIEGIKNTIFNIDQIEDEAVPEFLENKLADFFERIAMMDDPGAKAEEETSEESGKAQKHDPKKDSKFEVNGASGFGGQAGSEIMTPEELAVYFKIPANAIYDMLNEIPHFILAGRVRFRRSSIEKWLDSREKNAPAKRSTIRDFDDSVKLWRNVI